MSWSIGGLAQDARYAGRSFVRAPLTAVTIVLTIAIGLGLVAAVYTTLNSMIFSVDEVLNPHELFGIERQRSAIAESPRFSQGEYERLLRETDVFTDAFASTTDTDAWIEGIKREGRLVTGNFFQVLGVNAVRGQVFGPRDDVAGSPPVIVLSHRAWMQHYDGDPGVLDRTYRVNSTTFRIVGIMPEGFRGLEVIAAPDFWAPLAHMDIFNEPTTGEQSGRARGLDVVGRLEPGLSQQQAVARLNAWDLQRAAERSEERPASLLLAPRLGTVPSSADTMLGFLPLFFAFGLILMIGCANVANLLLARLFKRRREIGVRLAIGAPRYRVILQLLTENILLSLFAAVLAFIISRLVLRGIVYAITTSFPPDIGSLRLDVPGADWRVGLFLVAGAVVTTVLFALAPALRVTRLDISRAMHGEVMRDGRPGRARDMLIALQVTGSVLLLICAAIFLRSAWVTATIDPGFRTDDIVNVAVLNEERRPAILDAVGSEPSVVATAAAWPDFLGGVGGAPAYGEGAGGREVLTYQFVSPEFFDVLGIGLARGRGFTDAERDPNEGVAIVSETVARELWPDADALGQVLRVEPDLSILIPGGGADVVSDQPADPLLQPRTAVVVGIARDVAGIKIAGMTVGGSGVYMPISDRAANTVLLTRVAGDLEQARRAITGDLAAIDPNMTEVTTLQMLSNTNKYLLGTSFWLTFVLGLLAVLLTVSGLFSVLSFVVEQRTREIGVRMALGASRRKIGGLVLLQSARPVGIGMLLGGGLTVGLCAALLATPIAEQIAGMVLLFDPIAYAVSLACILAACTAAGLVPALAAGRVSPLTALRDD